MPKYRTGRNSNSSRDPDDGEHRKHQGGGRKSAGRHNVPHDLELSSRKRAARKSVALVDVFRLSRDCLTFALRHLAPELTIEGFSSTEDCLAARTLDLDAILLCSYQEGPLEGSVLQQVVALSTGFPSIPVILLAGSRDTLRQRSIRSALNSGAKGVIPMVTTEIGAAVAAISFVRAGGTFAPADILLHESLKELETAREAQSMSRLTLRQISVLALLRDGKPNKSIAYELGMKESTVKAHVRNIMRKLGVSNRTQAAFCADHLWHLPAWIAPEHKENGRLPDK